MRRLNLFQNIITQRNYIVNVTLRLIISIIQRGNHFGAVHGSARRGRIFHLCRMLLCFKKMEQAAERSAAAVLCADDELALLTLRIYPSERVGTPKTTADRGQKILDGATMLNADASKSKHLKGTWKMQAMMEAKWAKIPPAASTPAPDRTSEEVTPLMEEWIREIVILLLKDLSGRLLPELSYRIALAADTRRDITAAKSPAWPTQDI